MSDSERNNQRRQGRRRGRRSRKGRSAAVQGRQGTAPGAPRQDGRNTSTGAPSRSPKDRSSAAATEPRTEVTRQSEGPRGRRVERHAGSPPPAPQSSPGSGARSGAGPASSSSATPASAPSASTDHGSTSRPAGGHRHGNSGNGGRKTTNGGQDAGQRRHRKGSRRGGRGTTKSAQSTPGRAPARHTLSSAQRAGQGPPRVKSIDRRMSSQRGMKTYPETSAGGLVLRRTEGYVDEERRRVDLAKIEVAIIGRIDRRGRLLWSLPKGHIEDFETTEETAVREVAEETGIHGTIVEPLGVIDYWFLAEGKRIHKTVHHYLLDYEHGELDDSDAEISEVAWVPLLGLAERLAYTDERRLVRKAADKVRNRIRREYGLDRADRSRASARGANSRSGGSRGSGSRSSGARSAQRRRGGRRGQRSGSDRRR